MEAALVLPILLLLLFSMVDGGRVFHAWIVVTNGAREGARVAATGSPEPVVLDHVSSVMGSVAPYEVLSTNVGGLSGQAVTVEIRHDITLVTPLIGALFGGTVEVTGTAVMRLE